VEAFAERSGVVTRRKVRGKLVDMPKYSAYALRHYIASKLIEKGKDFKFIQTAMGHADIQLTLNLYGHLRKDKEAEHAQTADDLALELLPA
jgi:integrase